MSQRIWIAIAVCVVFFQFSTPTLGQAVNYLDQMVNDVAGETTYGPGDRLRADSELVIPAGVWLFGHVWVADGVENNPDYGAMYIAPGKQATFIWYSEQTTDSPPNCPSNAEVQAQVINVTFVFPFLSILASKTAWFMRVR